MQTHQQDHHKTASANLGLIATAIKLMGMRFDNDFAREDAWQEGYLGLVNAAAKWDAEGGAAFSTYAITGIELAIRRARGRHKGLNYRSAVREGRVPTPPVSLDAMAGEDGRPYSDSIADPTRCTESSGLQSVLLGEAAHAASAVCNDHIDRAILIALLDPTIGARHVRSTVAAETGLNVQAIRKRHLRLKRLLGHSLLDA